MQLPEEKKELGYSQLPLFISWHGNYGYAIGSDGERTYTFRESTIFINPTTRLSKKIFLGNLVNPLMDSYSDILEYRGYTLKPIDVGPDMGFLGIEFVTYTPSKAADEEYARQIMAQKPSQNGGFSAGNGVEYGSRRELHLVGLGNMALPLDEVISSGKSYHEQGRRCRSVAG